MPELSLNGEGVVSLALRLPRIGVWHADITLVPSAPLPEGRVTLDAMGTKYSGTVLRAGVSCQLPVARIVGGAGGMSKAIAPRSYQGVDVRLPLTSILSAAGETLSAAADSTMLARRLPFWIQMAASAGEALGLLLRTAAVPAWRVLADGTVWVGAENWPASKLADFSILSEDLRLGVHTVFAEEPSVFPGETWADQRVSVVEHRFSRERLQTFIWTEAAA